MRFKRHHLFEALEFTSTHGALGHALAIGIISLVFLNVTAVILETEPTLAAWKPIFHTFDIMSVAVFTAEYITRLWVCTEDKRYGGPLLGRLRYAVTPLALIDLLAILPFYLPLAIGYDLRFVRILRLMRVFRLLKTSRYFSAFHLMAGVMRSKREELLISLFAILVLLVFASCLMYEIEHQAQPGTFSSIPAAMWWGVVTLTTVGYGDIYPVTVGGKICAAAMAILSMGLFALPAGILASGFSEEMQNRRKAASVICPHCGRDLGDPRAASESEVG